MSRSRNEFLCSPPDAALPRDCLDFRVMPASFSLSSMDAPMLAADHRGLAFVSLGSGLPLSFLAPERVSVVSGSGQDWAPRRRRRGASCPAPFLSAVRRCPAL